MLLICHVTGIFRVASKCINNGVHWKGVHPVCRCISDCQMQGCNFLFHIVDHFSKVGRDKRTPLLWRHKETNTLHRLGWSARLPIESKHVHTQKHIRSIWWTYMVDIRDTYTISSAMNALPHLGDFFGCCWRLDAFSSLNAASIQPNRCVHREHILRDDAVMMLPHNPFNKQMRW